MQILHKIDGFLFTIFPDLKDAPSSDIITAFENYYTHEGYKPKVTIEDDFVIIDIDTNHILSQEADFRRVVSLCEQKRFEEAKPILKKLIDKNPANSEFHRIMGQVLSEEGDQEEAINCLIDALRWDSKNHWALLMMGNIFAKYKDDVATAMKYYDQALIAKPDDNIILNNIGGNLMQQGKIEEGKKYLIEALKINNEYPNTHYALAFAANVEGDLHSAFYSAIKAIKVNTNKDPLYNNSLALAIDIANKITATDEGKKIYKEYKSKLEFDGGTEVDITQDSSITTAAKMEFAENHNKVKHLIKYKPGYPAIEHLIMHELVHLDLVITARKAEVNQLFISTQNFAKDFIKGLEPTIIKLKKKGIPENSITQYCSNLFDGINSQIFNAPIDLFIEDFLYHQYPSLRPYQFLSLSTLMKEGLNAVTSKTSVELSPPNILSTSKVLNMVGAMQYKALYGIDLIKDYKATPNELKQAQGFYDEFLQYKEDKQPGEEYELVQHWAEDLKLDKNFELISETEYRSKRTDIDNLLDSIEKDPYGLESDIPFKEKEMETFQKTQADIGLNMAVVMYMVDALQYFESVPNEQIKLIAHEIAIQGTQGYSPDKKDYRISFIPGKLFSGYYILAYYYISWALAIPEILPQLKLPFDEEYNLAKTMFKPNK